MSIEGIRISEIPENDMEKRTMVITENKVLDSENIDFSDCEKTSEDKKRELQDLKEEILYYNSCLKTNEDNEIEDDYEDCRKK